MMSVFQRLARSIEIALLWNKALKNTSHKKYSESFSNLQCIYSKYSVSIPSVKLPPEMNVLSGLVTSRIGDYGLSIKSALLALQQLDDAAAGLSGNDRKYLRYYCKILIDHSAYKAGLTVPSLDALEIESEFRELNLRAVSSHIKSKFPV